MSDREFGGMSIILFYFDLDFYTCNTESVQKQIPAKGGGNHTKWYGYGLHGKTNCISDTSGSVTFWKRDRYSSDEICMAFILR